MSLPESLKPEWLLQRGRWPKTIGFILDLLAPNTAFNRAAIPQLKERFPEEWAQIWQAKRD